MEVIYFVLGLGLLTLLAVGFAGMAGMNNLPGSDEEVEAEVLKAEAVQREWERNRNLADLY